MEYQKIIKFIRQPYFNNWVEINDDARGTYNTNSQMKFKTSMLRSRLCGYSDAYILIIGVLIVPNTGAVANSNNGKI